MGKKVLVLAELKDGHLRNVAFEAVSAAKLVAGDGEVIATILGSNASTQVDKLAQYGANIIYTVADEKLNQYTSTTYVQAFLQVINEVRPDVIFLGHTAIGKDLAPRIAAKLEIGLISDATDLTVE